MNTRRDEIRLRLTRQLQQMIGEIVEELMKAIDEDIENYKHFVDDMKWAAYVKQSLTVKLMVQVMKGIVRAWSERLRTSLIRNSITSKP